MSIDLMTTIPTSTTNEPVDPHYTILIVDDNPTNLRILSNYLKSLGYQTILVQNGGEAIRQAQEFQPDIILLDVMMPGIDGFETCQLLKANEQTRDIPVIFMTALSATRDKVKGFQAGAVDYVTKPLQFEEVLARLSTHLNIRNLTRDLQTQNIHLQDMTTELQQANKILFKRNVQLAASSEVGQQVTSLLDLDELLWQVVDLIQTKFTYYFVGIWLLNEEQNAVILQAWAGTTDVVLSESTYRLTLDEDDCTVIWVCKNRNPCLTEQVTAASLSLKSLTQAKSELTLPLRIAREVVAVLDIVSDQMATFTPDDQVVLQGLADQIAIAIRNAQLYKAEQRRRQLAESLEQVGRVLSSDLDLRQVPQRVLDELLGVVPYERGSVFLKWGNELQSIAKRGYPSARTTTELHVTIDEGGVFQRMVETGQPVLVADVTQDPGWQQMAWLPIHHSWLGVPLIVKDRVIGMISLTRREVAAFSEDETHSVLAFAGQAAIALENAGLFDEINRFNEQLEQKVTQRTNELNKAYKILERLDKTKTDFINVTSHELRTPLAVIKGYSQILRALPVVADPEVDKLTTGIIQGVNRLHQIVDTMLDVVKIDTQVLQVRREAMALVDTIQKIKEALESALQERQQILTLIDVEHLPLIEANPDLIFKVFFNLIINAIKYTPDGGSITVSGQSFASAGQQATIEIIVSDNGIGIDPEHHDRIFEKFYQTSEVAFHSSGQTKFKGGGPGLGLALVRGIIEAHGGRVWVESPGYDEQNYPGSHFYVHLPQKQPMA